MSKLMEGYILKEKQILGIVLAVVLVIFAGIMTKNNHENITYNIGEVISIGKVNYKVNNFEIRNSNDMKGRNDLIVSIDVTSKSEESEKASFEDSFVLKIGDKTFEADSTRSGNANGGSNPFRYNQLNPDQKIQGFVVFNISKNQAESKKFDLLIKEGSFSSEEATVKLK
ncbi:hypothetical protein CKN73_13500 [Carnobacterium divergens]|nr:hypothetical protein CKN77_13455 [Carnobacterium divergens]TFJ46526.1 hypothetical protein CKN73_13500 [Carnobacterium divergens]TFJ51377.1 hypothetical protein CKN83_13225 [Carnobacterium divergens]TFJ59536.1 hypothetical protein CKN89_07665 [Carnobacterium divergens]TFJ68408.1 hypothetical protein CKN78_13480 [Carnobacterium divergens]